MSLGPVDAPDPLPKSAVRRRARARRSAVEPAETAHRGPFIARRVLEIVPADAILLGYSPMPGEPDVVPALIGHLARGGRVMVPVICQDPPRTLLWAPWHPRVETRPSRFAPVAEPVGERLELADLLGGDADSPSVHVLVPATAVDTAGYRLGQGGGYYDTTFGPFIGEDGGPGLDRSRLTGIVHDDEVLLAGSFTVEPHDLRVGRVVTEERLITC